MAGPCQLRHLLFSVRRCIREAEPLITLLPFQPWQFYGCEHNVSAHFAHTVKSANRRANRVYRTGLRDTELPTECTSLGKNNIPPAQYKIHTEISDLWCSMYKRVWPLAPLSRTPWGLQPSDSVRRLGASPPLAARHAVSHCRTVFRTAVSYLGF